MTPLGEILRDQILRSGSMPFSQFMEAALYHPEFGYYRRGRDPFGRDGDYYTAEQLQPVFGILIAARIHQLYSELGKPSEFTVVELVAILLHQCSAVVVVGQHRVRVHSGTRAGGG